MVVPVAINPLHYTNLQHATQKGPNQNGTYLGNQRHRWSRTVTLAQFRAEIDARKAAAAPIMDAWRRGDLKACEVAQAAMRKRFPK
jgi:hypothetical protein